MKPVFRQTLRVSECGFLFCIAYTASVLLQTLLSSALPQETAMWACYMAMGLVYMAAIPLGSRMLGAPAFTPFGINTKPKGKTIVPIVLLAIFSLVAFMPLQVGMQRLLALVGYTDAPNYADYSSSWWRVLLGVVFLAIMPALGEETLVRGCLFAGLKRRGTMYGIMLSALLFALMHGSPVQLVHQFLIGVIMAYLVHMTGSLWSSIIFHFVNNATVILLDYACLQTGTEGWMNAMPWWGWLAMLVAGSGALVGVLAWLLRILRPRSMALSDNGEEEKKPLRMRIVKTLDIRGEFAPYNTAEPLGIMWVAILLVALTWLMNTIFGWIK